MKYIITVGDDLGFLCCVSIILLIVKLRHGQCYVDCRFFVRVTPFTLKKFNHNHICLVHFYYSWSQLCICISFSSI